MSDIERPVSDAKAESFFGRFSRRKLEEASGVTTGDTEDRGDLHIGEEQPATEPSSTSSKAKDRALTDADMPPLESLTEDSDYSGFLSPKVSRALQKQALRKLFHGASFNLCDGLDDYADDFTSFTQLGDLVTSDMRFQAEEALKKIEQERLSETTAEAQPAPSNADGPNEPMEAGRESGDLSIDEQDDQDDQDDNSESEL